MGFLARTLKFLIALVLTAAVVLWFAARRGDRGYIQEEISIDRGAPVAFRWITSDELLQRWISDVIKLEKAGSTGPRAQVSGYYRLQRMSRGRPWCVDCRIPRAYP